MAKDEVLVKLQGKHGEIDPLAVADAITALDKIMRNIDGEGEPELTLSNLKIGSAQYGVKTDSRRVERLSTGIQSLTYSAMMPDGWNSASMAGLVELEKVNQRRGVTAIQVDIDGAVCAIDEVIADNASLGLQYFSVSLGSIRGQLFRYANDVSRRSAGLRDRNTGKAVDLKFPERLAQEIKAHLDQQVTAWGEVYRSQDGTIAKIKLEGIEAIPGSQEQLTLDEVAGILGRDWTGGLDPVDWVRHQRD
ncbi:hypothetical protein QNA24_34265 [Rhodococcus qingshengii]|uniref:hypothetical protein n=1 Tax=Rhodococcus qingshengii TaxID=334542 RepID=UPI0024BAC80A|nr:hypothetical protein [Rhodococcus qingshengii]MDJ0491447.1 hypothetical protein [Rhodococcus qingshengii]